MAVSRPERDIVQGESERWTITNIPLTQKPSTTCIFYEGVGGISIWFTIWDLIMFMWMMYLWLSIFTIMLLNYIVIIYKGYSHSLFIVVAYVLLWSTNNQILSRSSASEWKMPLELFFIYFIFIAILVGFICSSM